VYEEIKEKIASESNEDIKELCQDFLKDACDYADNRKAWAFMDKSAQIRDDKTRSIKHDAYMSMLGAICDNIGIKDIEAIMPDRKAKGDFACYIALFLALEQR